MSTVDTPSQLTPAFSRGRFLVLWAGVLWSLAGVFIKFLELHPLAIVFYRSLFASLFFSLFVRRKSWTFHFPLSVSVLSYTAAVSSFVWANKLTTAANAIVLQYTAPIFVFIFVRMFFGEQITRINLLALVMGMSGIGVIFGGSAGQPDAAGVLVALLSGFLFSIYIVNLRRLREIDAGYLTLVNNLVCCLLLLPVAGASLALSPSQALALAVMGVVQLGIPYFLFSKGLETISLQEASLIVLVEPVLNPVWVTLAVGEVPSGATLIGGTIIMASLGLRYVWLLLSKPDQISPSSRT